MLEETPRMISMHSFQTQLANQQGSWYKYFGDIDKSWVEQDLDNLRYLKSTHFLKHVSKKVLLPNWAPYSSNHRKQNHVLTLVCASSLENPTHWSRSPRLSQFSESTQQIGIARWWSMYLKHPSNILTPPVLSEVWNGQSLLYLAVSFAPPCHPSAFASVSQSQN
jgi:hypothetical protein